MPAKKESINKSKAVRDYLVNNPKAGPQEVSQALAKQGIKISPKYVSIIKSKMRKGKRRRRRQKAAEVLSVKTGVGVPEIKAAFVLLKQCGSLADARKALEAAVEIKKVI
jgi:hypothetical protein